VCFAYLCACFGTSILRRHLPKEPPARHILLLFSRPARRKTYKACAYDKRDATADFYIFIFNFCSSKLNVPPSAAMRVGRIVMTIDPLRSACRGRARSREANHLPPPCAAGFFSPFPLPFPQPSNRCEARSWVVGRDMPSARELLYQYL
jgi:hypothetical protein